MATAVEVNQRLQGNLCCNILLRLCGLELLGGGVVAGDICLMVLGMVELHDLARDGWLKCAIVVCNEG